MSASKRMFTKRNVSVLVIVLLATVFFTRLPSANAMARWDLVSLPSGTPQLTGVGMTSVNDGWAVGLNKAILRWDGSAWNTWVQDPPPTPPPQPHLFSITMINANDGWAVGWGWIIHWDGTAWTSVTCPTTMIISSISMLGADEGWAVGQSGTIIHYQAGEWSSVTSPTTMSLFTVSMISATDGWAVGDAGTIIHWDGSSWTEAASPTTSGLYSLLMTRTTDGWIGGASGLLLRWDGSSWTQWHQDHPPVADHLYGISMVNPDDVWAVGASGTLLHWNGIKWSNAPNPTTRSLKFVSMVDGIDGWAVGGEGSGIAIRDAPAETLEITVSYEVVGDGTGYSAPGFRYSEGGVWQDVELTPTPTVYSVDAGTTWTASPNPLDHSTDSERWFSTQDLSGTPSGQTLVFSFQHQYYLATEVNPASGGATDTPSDWKNSGTGVSVTPTASGGYVFDHWMLDDSDVGSGDPSTHAYTVTMDAAHALEAVFVTVPPVQYGLTISASPLDAGTTDPVVGVHSYDSGTGVSVTPTASGGYVFDHWMLDAVNVGSGDPSTHAHTVTMDADHALEAVFVTVPPVQYDLTISASPSDAGATDPAVGVHTYGGGTPVAVTATASGGYVFDHWALDSVDVGSANPYTVTMDGAHALEAIFVTTPPTTVQITIDSSPLEGLGYIEVEGNPIATPSPFTWDPGSTSKLTAVPTASCDSGCQYVFVSWTSPSIGTIASAAFKYTVPSSAETVTANYQKQYYLTMQVASGLGGTVSPESGWYDESAQVQIEAECDPGYVFTGWIGEGTGYYTGSDQTTTVTVGGPIVETANFQLAPEGTVTINIDAQPQDSVQNNIIVDGAPVTTPVSFDWAVGSRHTLSAVTPISCSASFPAPCRYAFQSWSDDGAQEHTIVVPDSTTTYVASYARQFWGSFTVEPQQDAGSVCVFVNQQERWCTSDQVSDWLNENDAVQMSATPNDGYSFDRWVGTGEGSYDGSENPSGTFTVQAPITELAQFVQGDQLVQITVDSDPAGQGWVSVDGTAITTPYTFDWAIGSQHTLSGVASIGCGDSCQYGFQTWSNYEPSFAKSGKSQNSNDQEIGQTITVPESPTTYTAFYTEQFWTVLTITPAGSGYVCVLDDQHEQTQCTGSTTTSGWADEGSEVQLLAIPNTNYKFTSWAGTGDQSYSGDSNPSGNLIIHAPITETATFTENAPTTQVTMTVSFSIVGGGTGYSAPVINYVQNGVNTQYSLTTVPTGITVDEGSAWSVTPNPLGGSSGSERWYASNQQLSGNAYAQSYVFTFQHQYYCTVQADPAQGGTAQMSGSSDEDSGWAEAGAQQWVIAAPNSGYEFASWTGTGSGSYTGSAIIGTITVNEHLIEVAHFIPQVTGKVTMAVSYSVTGSGTGYSAPSISYVEDGTSKQYQLTGTPTNIEVDKGTSWSVRPNPLLGSNTNERWYTNQPLSAAAAAGTYTFNFQHQYYLTMESNPADGGSTAPGSGWQNAGATVYLSASARSDYAFSAWMGSGTGSYTGATNPATITVDAPVIEMAYFERHAPPLQTYLITVNTHPTGLDRPQGGGEYAQGATITISVSSVDDYTFEEWQRDGTEFTSDQSFQYTVDGTHTFTAVFEAIQPPTPGQVTVLVASNPAGTGFVNIDGTIITAPQVFSWEAGSTHTIVAISPVNGEDGTRYVWIDWSDSGAQTHTITVPNTAAITYTASFKLQYSLTVAITPEGTGTADPGVGQHWYDSGVVVQVNALPSSGYSFQSWIGAGSGYTGTDNPAAVTMEHPITETAALTQSPPVSHCIIATAAYGSPMNPEVVYMRYVRDKMIGSTPTGHLLRDGWNWFYYLWSPPVAEAISASPTLQAGFRVLLLPLVGIIHTTGWVFTVLGGSDIASIIAFITAAIMSTTVYIIAPAMATRTAWKYRRKHK